MDQFNLDAARLVRMWQDIGALLPDDDPAMREEICRLLVMGNGEGLDLFPQFRDLVGRRSKPRADSALSILGDGLEMEALPE